MPLSKLTKAQLLGRINELEADLSMLMDVVDKRNVAAPVATAQRRTYYDYVATCRAKAKQLGLSTCRYLPFATWSAQRAA